MSDLRPVSGPPPKYVAYPRGAQRYGDPDKLQALCDGYFNLNYVFLLNVLIAIASNVVPVKVATIEELYGFRVGMISGVGLIVGFASYPANKKIGFGAGWSPSGPVIASVLMGINSALCCGIIGYVWVQQLAVREMSKYGLRVGFGGSRRADIEKVVAEMRASAPVPPGPYASPPPGQP